MTTETTQVHEITEVPSKKSKLRIPFPKKTAAEASETTEAAPRKRPLHGVYALGAILVAGAAVAAVGSKLRHSDDSETTDVPSDNSAA